MNAPAGALHDLLVLARHEVRLRLRRTSTLVALLAVVVLGWLAMPDPSTGMTLMQVNDARVLYTSATIALGSAGLANLLFGLGGFYLVRGRVAEDIRTGIGAVAATTPARNVLQLAGRWAGSVAYLCALGLAFMTTMMVCQLIRGDGPVQPLTYLVTYAALLLPAVLFTASGALLCDSMPWLLGKAGDVLWFVVWALQIGMMAIFDSKAPVLRAAMVFDSAGLSVIIASLHAIVHTTNIAIGVAPFDPHLAPLRLPDQVLGAQALLLRAGTAVLALAPAVLAVPLFHRFSPDRVRAGAGRRRRSPLALLNTLVRPLARLAPVLLHLAARAPAAPARLLADLALTVSASPVIVLVLVAGWIAALLPPGARPGAVLGLLLAWGVVCASLATRDFDADLELLAGAAPGGPVQAFTRRATAMAVLGLLVLGPAAARWLAEAPLRGAAACAGVLLLAACATTFGRLARTPRLFLALFLFVVYVAVNAPTVPWLDLAGFNGSATAASVALHAMLGTVLFMGGWWWNRRAWA